MSGVLSRIAVSMAAAVAGGTTWLAIEPGARTVLGDFVGLELGPSRTADATETVGGVVGLSLEHHPDAHPSFDCEQATTTVEHMICSDPAIAEADRVLDRMWGTLGRQELITDELRNDQRQWIVKRDGCLIDDDPHGCVRRVMLDRITVLSEL